MNALLKSLFALSLVVITPAFAQETTTNTAPLLPLVPLQMVSLQLVDGSAAEGVTASGALNVGSVRVSRTGATNEPLNVRLVYSGKASNGVDYATLPGYVTIPARETSTLVTVVPVDDTIAEPTESVIIQLLAQTGYGIVTSNSANTTAWQATVLIADNDNKAPEVTWLSPVAGSVYQLPTSVVLRVSANDPDGTVRNVSFFAGTNKLGVVYGSNGLYSFTWQSPLVGNQTLTAKAADNFEASRVSPSLSISVLAPVVVTNEPSPKVWLSSGDLDAQEAPLLMEGGVMKPANPATFTVNRSGSTNASLIVYYQVSGSATPGLDYESLGSRVEIPVGSRSVNLTVKPLDDTEVEPTESVIFSLLPPVTIAIYPPPPGYYQLNGVTTLTATIRDNDQPTNTLPVVVVETVDPNAAETAPGAELNPGVFRFRREGPTNGALTVYYRFEGTAINGQDFGQVGGSTLIPAGQSTATLTIQPVDDSQPEFPETVNLILMYPPTTTDPTMGVSGNGTFAPVVAYAIGKPDRGVVTIADNDTLETNLPPLVRITSPVNGSVFTAPARITILADARDLGGVVSSVEFFVGTNSLGVVNSSSNSVSPVYPFLFNWTNVNAGEYVLTALATDDQGVTRLSEPVKVRVTDRVTNSIPVVSITAIDAFASEGVLTPEWPSGTVISNTVSVGGANTYPTNFLVRTNPGVFLIKRDGPTNAPLLVQLTIDGTASNGVDYAALASSVLVPAGQRSVQLVVAPVDDAVVEDQETVRITLVSPLPPPVLSSNLNATVYAAQATGVAPAYLIGYPTRATVTIADNDRPRLPIRLPDGQYHFWQTGTNGQVYVIEVSSDLRTWIPVSTNTVVEGTVHYVDTDSGDFKRRFYRAVTLP
jgi:hypothetical protein